MLLVHMPKTTQQEESKGNCMVQTLVFYHTYKTQRKFVIDFKSQHFSYEEKCLFLGNLLRNL